MSLLVLGAMATIMLCGSHMHRYSTPDAVISRSGISIALPHCSTITVCSPSTAVTYIVEYHGKSLLPGERLSYQLMFREHPGILNVWWRSGVRNTSASAVQGMPLLSQLIPDKEHEGTRICSVVVRLCRSPVVVHAE